MKKILKPIVRTIVETPLRSVENRLLAQYGKNPVWPHIFITGAPRSGTSLFYEALVTRFYFSYITNLADRFPRTPAAVSWLFSSAQANRISKYSSDYGTIPGLFAPNEAGGLWNLWNAHGDWNDETFLPELPVDRMRKTLTAISTITGNPFVNKNVMHANRIRMLDAVFPGCLFIEVRRNPREVARSIIRAQPEEKSPQPQSDGWWSVRPLNATGTHPVEQAVRQIEGVTADIARDTEALIRPCLYTVEYESFCAAPEVEMYKVAEFLSTHGVEIAVRSKIPDAFELRPSTPLLAKDEERLDESMCRTRTGADTP